METESGGKGVRLGVRFFGELHSAAEKSMHLRRKGVGLQSDSGITLPWSSVRLHLKKYRILLQEQVGEIKARRKERKKRRRKRRREKRKKTKDQTK